ncbi:MAG: 3-dehydroquinate synthase [Clostridia bacterium]|nr:3-dehydroquinate synthase [Clostridia bacterium]
MQDIVLSAEGLNSVIHCGAGAFEKYAREIQGNLFVVTDSNVYRLYSGLIKETFKDAPVYVLPAGEKSKNKTYLMDIFKHMIEAGVTRKSTAVAFGGGVVGDITGLAASLYMRGINVVQIPTTLLSQVDSSVGGKTAIDFGGVKNVIGSFYQPSQVIVDPVFLKTLPAREIRCGLGEIVKYGALDGDIYDKLTENISRLSDLEFLEQITTDCIRHKAKVVTEDEKDLTGARKTLNLGHTTGHAFELYYKRKSHGEFVLIGMYYELFIARRKGVCGGEYADSLCKLIKKVIKTVPSYADVREAAAMAKYDKKNEKQSVISFIVPAVKGKSAEIILPIGEYLDQVEACAKELKEND